MAMTFGTSGTMADEVINGQFLQKTKGMDPWRKLGSFHPHPGD